MRERRTHIGHDGSQAREERRPADIGGDRHQDLPGLELVAIFGLIQFSDCAFHYPCRASVTMDGAGGRGRCGLARIEEVAAPFRVGCPGERVEVTDDHGRIGRQGAVPFMSHASGWDVGEWVSCRRPDPGQLIQR